LHQFAAVIRRELGCGHELDVAEVPLHGLHKELVGVLVSNLMYGINYDTLARTTRFDHCANQRGDEKLAEDTVGKENYVE
jgi:hypothetical protein